jgi:hypothetical protein
VTLTPFFSLSEARRLNAYIAVAHFHGETEFASRLSDTLLMPFPDEDIVRELTTSHILDTGTYDEIISAAHDLDHVLKINCSSFVVLKTSPFHTEYIDGMISGPCTFYKLNKTPKAPKRKVTNGRKV